MSVYLPRAVSCRLMYKVESLIEYPLSYARVSSVRRFNVLGKVDLTRQTGGLTLLRTAPACTVPPNFTEIFCAYYIWLVLCTFSFIDDAIFSARCNIYISRLCYDVSVRLSVCDGSTLAHYS